MEAAAAAAAALPALVPSQSAVVVLLAYLVYLAAAGAVLPGKIVAGAVLPDSSRLHYRCNGLLSLLLLLGLSALGVYMGWMSSTVVADRGLELLSATFIFSILVGATLDLTMWLGVQLNPHFMGVDLKFFFVRAGMMAWLFINLSLFAKSYLAGSVNLSVILYQFFCGWYIIDYFVHEEFMTSTWDIIAERLGFMLVFGDLVFIPFTFTIQLVVLHYRGIARHCNYLGDLLLALSFSLPCGASSVIPYFYPTYLLILLIWRERRDEARCSQKYKEIWVEYCKLVPWRILPYVY
ncbi:hypothetical protein PR202_ga16691 [Eleusine coracana subsp. coracana]|uniref:Uncharacterized protein n=1 Tax=Eleusine coracana subsp. coracana TaxID=191504 RepID=A0AAV5CN47_ELECO|nr:hypothetical protein PR202_ga16691 [Eleusine coracana subsp. coracana]